MLAEIWFWVQSSNNLHPACFASVGSCSLVIEQFMRFSFCGMFCIQSEQLFQIISSGIHSIMPANHRLYWKAFSAK